MGDYNAQSLPFMKERVKEGGVDAVSGFLLSCTWLVVDRRGLDVQVLIDRSQRIAVVGVCWAGARVLVFHG